MPALGFTYQLACPALVIHILLPLMTYYNTLVNRVGHTNPSYHTLPAPCLTSSPFLTAVLLMPATSDPACGSVTPYDYKRTQSSTRQSEVKRFQRLPAIEMCQRLTMTDPEHKETPSFIDRIHS